MRCRFADLLISWCADLPMCRCADFEVNGGEWRWTGFTERWKWRIAVGRAAYCCPVLFCRLQRHDEIIQQRLNEAYSLVVLEKGAEKITRSIQYKDLKAADVWGICIKRLFDFPSLRLRAGLTRPFPQYIKIHNPALVYGSDNLYFL